MSTVYLTEPKIPSLAALESSLPEGITVVHRNRYYSWASCCLTDGTNSVHAFEPTLVWLERFHPPAVPQVCFERFGRNQVGPIFTKLSEAFGVTFTDEYGVDLHPED